MYSVKIIVENLLFYIKELEKFGKEEIKHKNF